MSKRHSDNHKARKKIGDTAFKLKNKRREASRKLRDSKCGICGHNTRFINLTDGVCGGCRERLGLSLRG